MQWYEEAPPAAPANAPGFTGYIPGQAKPEKPDKPQFVPAGATEMLLQDGSIVPIPGKEGEGKKSPEAIRRVLEEIDSIAEDAMDNEGWGETGLTGAALGKVPGGAGYSLRGRLKGLGDKIAVDAIAALADEGVKLGPPMSDYDIQLARNSIANIDPNQDNETFLAALKKARQTYEDLYTRAAGQAAPPPSTPLLGGGAPAPAVAPAPGPEKPAGTPVTPEAVAAETAELTEGQQRAYEAFWGANPNPTPDQLNQFYVSIGLRPAPNAEDIIKAMKEGRGYSTTRENDIRQRVEEEDPGLSENVTALGAQGITLGLSDELRGAGGFLRGGVEGYRNERDLERARIANAREQMGGWGTALELGSSLLTAPIGATAAGVRGLAQLGAKFGALSGFGYGEGVGESLGGALGGAAVGGTAAGALGWAAPKVAPAIARLRGNQVQNPQVAQAALDEGLEIPGVLVTGRQRDINKIGRLEADPTAAPVIRAGLDNVTGQVEGKVAALGRGGTSDEPFNVGEAVRTAAKDIVDADKKAYEAAYKAAEKIDRDPLIDAATMRARLDRDIARLQVTPGTNREAIRTLQRYRTDIEKPIPLSAMRRMRSTLREAVSSPDLSTTSAQKMANRRALAAIDGANADFKAGLSPEAFDAWKAADKQFGEAKEYIKSAIAPFFGKDIDKLPAETVFQRLVGAGTRNQRALASIHRRLPADLSRDVAATIANSLGRRGPDEEFSTDLFISQARKLSPSARETFFGPSGARSIDNLLRVSRALKRTKGEINTSKNARTVTAVVREKAHHLVTALLGMGGLAGGGPIGGAAGVAAGVALTGVGSMIGGTQRFLSARALMNPRVTRWLENAVNTNTEAQARENVRRLAIVISREPAVAGELQPLYDMLSERVALPLAAEPQPEDANDDR